MGFFDNNDSMLPRSRFEMLFAPMTDQRRKAAANRMAASAVAQNVRKPYEQVTYYPAVVGFLPEGKVWLPLN